MSNLQVLGQFVTSLHRMSSEMLNLGMGRVVFPSEEAAALSTAPRASRWLSTWSRWVARKVLPGEELTGAGEIVCEVRIRLS